MEGRRIGKYLVQASLGEGGMGQVLLARDSTLGRTVALKLVRRGGDEAFVRLLLEAQALARLDHPNICRVYEVGDHDGQPFIAMQHLEGETLAIAALRLSLTEKVMLMRAVAEALHAVHRLGLVHRDLKPANIMVSRSEEGGLRPVVLDFGLVRDEAAPGLTRTGMPLGTPAYMSPEQADGESARVDRRSDIFSLGATLHAILIGRPPFDASSPAGILRQLRESEVAAPRGLDPGLPRDLETILLKCLERKPERRYDTAKELADELGRFLGGEPIAAKRPSRLARWVSRARRQPWVVGSLGFAAILLGLLVIQVVRNRFALERASQVAVQMGAVSRSAESRMRVAYLLPPHDLGPDKEAIRGEMANIQTLMDSLPSKATGPAHLALGRGHMALGEWTRAKESLERAWALGTRTPEASLALGLAQAELYQRRMRVVAQLKQPEIRERELREARAGLQVPALQNLENGRLASPAPAYTDALRAWLGGDATRALNLAEIAVRENPSAYEANLLAGAIHQQRYIEAVAAKDWPSSESEERAIRASYTAAALVGRSDPRALEGLACQLIFSHNDRGVYRDQTVDDLLDQTDRITQELLRVDSESARGHCCRAYVLWRRAHGPEDNRLAIQEARLATRYDPDDDYGWVLLAATLSRAVDYQWEAGQDPEVAIEESVAASESLLKLVPPVSHHGLIALEKLTKAKLRRYQFHVERGQATDAEEDATREAVESAMRVEPQYQFFEQMAAWFHLHAAWRAEVEGRDPEPEIKAILTLSQRTEGAAMFAARRLELRTWGLLALAEHRIRHRASAAKVLLDLDQALSDGRSHWRPSGIHGYAIKAALLRVQDARADGRSDTAALARGESHLRALASLRRTSADEAWIAQVPALKVELALRRVELSVPFTRSAALAWPTEGWLERDGTFPSSLRALARRFPSEGQPSGPELVFERPGTRAALWASLRLFAAKVGEDPTAGRETRMLLPQVASRDALLIPLLASHRREALAVAAR